MIKIEKWLLGGTEQIEKQNIEDTDELLEAAGGYMDSNCVSDVMGTVLFVGESGQVFKGEIQFIIEAVDEAEARSLLAEHEEDTMEKLEELQRCYGKSDGG